MQDTAFTYSYPFPSEFRQHPHDADLRLASFNPHIETTHFFDAEICNPPLLSRHLSLLHKVIQTHFVKPMPAQLDPVMTCNEQMLRFEGFSTCCGVYVRLDARTDAFSIKHLGRGTTNVDFNAPMQSAIAMLASSKKANLKVGTDEIMLEKDGESVREKRVQLPVRWLKGFGEVQNLQSSLDFMFSISSVKALPFFRSIPSGRGPSQYLYITKHGDGLRASSIAKNDAVRVSGLSRLKGLESLLSRDSILSIWCNNDLGVSAWSVKTELGHFTLLLSPDLYRGFSGEGRLLSQLLKDKTINAQIRSQLHWQNNIKVDQLATRLGKNEETVTTALQQLSAEGLLGFDLGQQSYYHRELPFNLKRIDQIQPRLKNAKRLLEDNRVVKLNSGLSRSYFKVKSQDTDYLVTFSEQDEQCSCPWYSRYRNQRGPCKHILAARLFMEDMK
jgi:hypothetical protein